MLKPDPTSPPETGVTIVTHSGLPGGAPDDFVLADTLATLGVDCRFARWDDRAVRWSETAVAIVRSTWDYHLSPSHWYEWIERAASATTLLNSATILRWNTDKRYLRALARRGVRCVPTFFASPQAGISLRTIMSERGWHDVIVKPAIAASASRVCRFVEGVAEADGEEHLAELLKDGSALVQPYLKVIEKERERALVFVDGAFAHAYTKAAFNRDASGGTILLPHTPTPGELSLAKAALAATPGWPTYARIDMLPDDAGPLLLELELIEPDLGLRLNSAAANRLAAACLRIVEGAAKKTS